MRERCACDRLVRTISASMKADGDHKSAPGRARKRQQDRQRHDAERNRAAQRFAEGSETTLCSTNSAGRIRNAPSTFGSLNVPRARS